MKPGAGPGGGWCEWSTGEVWCEHQTVVDMHNDEELELFQYEWERRLSILPKRCRHTKQHIRPFTYAYRGRKILHGPGEDIILERWLSAEGYTFAKLKGDL